MDNLTHTALGLFLCRAGLNRWTPRATAILLLAANAPDMDVVTAAGGSLNYLNYHRHFTHSLAALPLMALLPVLLVRAATRKPVRWAGAYAGALIAVATHLALDWTNMYGVRLLSPFSGRWFQGDLCGVVDLWIWGALLLGLAGPFLSRLVNAEIGASSRGRPYGRGWAWCVLLFLLFYDGARWYLHARAMEVLDSRLYEGGAPVRVAALPSAANPLAWRGLVETDYSFSVHQLNLLHEFDPAAGVVFHKPDAAPAIDVARATGTFRDFLRFSQYPMFRVLPLADPEGGKRVEVVDMRFGTPAQPGFIASATLNGRLDVIETFFQFGRFRPR
jgi:inner membrane protein